MNGYSTNEQPELSYVVVKSKNEVVNDFDRRGKGKKSNLVQQIHLRVFAELRQRLYPLVQAYPDHANQNGKVHNQPGALHDHVALNSAQPESQAT